MRNNIDGVNEDYPTARRTDRPHGQRRDATTETPVSDENEDRVGTGSPLQEYRFSKHNNPRINGIDSDAVQQVYDALVEVFDADGTAAYLKSPQLQRKADGDLDDIKTDHIGKALSELADTADCPLDIERWSGESTIPALWMVTVKTPIGAETRGGQELVTDGGWPQGDPCPDCGELMDVGAVGNPGETITWQECEDCGVGWGPWTGYVDTGDDGEEELVTDGGKIVWNETDGPSTARELRIAIGEHFGYDLRDRIDSVGKSPSAVRFRRPLLVKIAAALPNAGDDVRHVRQLSVSELRDRILRNLPVEQPDNEGHFRYNHLEAIHEAVVEDGGELATDGGESR